MPRLTSTTQKRIQYVARLEKHWMILVPTTSPQNTNIPSSTPKANYYNMPPFLNQLEIDDAIGLIGRVVDDGGKGPGAKFGLPLVGVSVEVRLNGLSRVV